MKLWIVILILGQSLSSHAAVKVMAIGDSMTEEYHFEIPFSAPDSDPANANTMNWVEILHERRGGDLDFGDYESSWPFGYLDWRQAGHDYNFGVPGSDTNKWMHILHPDISDWENYLFDIATRNAMRSHYAAMDVIVIMLGGNDVNFEYGDLYNTTPNDAFAQAFIANVINNLNDLFDEIRDYNASVPIVLANIPDLGATPDIIGDHPDPAKRSNATAIIADLNQAVAALASARGATLAPISHLTDRILSPDPLYIGAIEMIKGKDPENPPKYLFCKGGLHPSTNGQSVIANTLLAAINTATGSDIPLLADREIVSELLGLNPDQPFLDWATTAGLTDLSMTADTDGDGIPSLGEYLLDLNPLRVNAAHIASVQDIAGVPTLTLDYTADTAAGRLAHIVVKHSGNLQSWSAVPAENLIDLGGGTYQARMPASAGLGFFRMEFELKP